MPTFIRQKWAKAHFFWPKFFLAKSHAQKPKTKVGKTHFQNPKVGKNFEEK